MNRTYVVCIAALLSLFGPACAATIEGSSSGAFANPSGLPEMVISGIGTSSITWGDPVDFGTGPGRMSFTGQPFSTSAESEFLLGALDYFNGSVAFGTSPRAVALQVSLLFTDPAGVSATLLFPLTLINTPNEGTAEEQADIVFLPRLFPTTIFHLNGVPHTVRMSFGMTTSGGFSENDRFFVYEGQSARAELRGVVTTNISQVVPEPSTWVMLIAGLALLVRHRPQATRALIKSTSLGIVLLLAHTSAYATDKSFGSWGGSGQPCAIVTVDDQGSYKRGQTLGVRVFSRHSGGSEQTTAPDEIPRKLAEAIVEKLAKSKFFKSVSLVEPGSEANTDYLLDGHFLDVRKGNALLRSVAFGVGDARFWLWLTVRAGPDYAQRVAVIDCDSARAVTVGSMFTIARVAGGGASGKINQIAESLVKQFEISEAAIQARASRKQPKALTGKSQDPNRSGRFGRLKNIASAGTKAMPLPGKSKDSTHESPENEDEQEQRPNDGDHGQQDELKHFRQGFMSFRTQASRGRKGPRRVEAVWVTPQAFQAFLRLSQDVSAKEPSVQRELRYGMIGAKPHLESVTGKNLLVFILSYQKISWFGPILWDFGQVKNSISLRNPDSKQALQPALVIDQPAPPSVQEGTYYSTRTLLIGFAADSEKDESWKGGLNSVELVVEIEGVPIALSFELTHAGATSLQDLALPRQQL